VQDPCAAPGSNDATQSAATDVTMLPNVVNGWTVGTGHFNQLEVPDQVNAMIEAFLRHYV
jgi:hypothetical protein